MSLLAHRHTHTHTHTHTPSTRPLPCSVLTPRTGTLDTAGTTLDELYSNISECDFSMPARADDVLKVLLSGILHKDPEERLTLDQIFEQPWCDNSSLESSVNLTQVLLDLAKLDATHKKSLMKRFMEEENDSDDDQSDATTADEDDVDKLDPTRYISCNVPMLIR